MNTPITMTPLDIRHAADHEYAALNRFNNLLRAERLPDDPPIALEEFTNRMRYLPPVVDVYMSVVWNQDQTDLIALSSVEVLRIEQNQHLTQFQVNVTPAYRRQGIGRQLLVYAAETTRHEGRTLMTTQTNGRVPAGDAFMEHLGARRGLVMRVNQLDVQELNRDLVRQWIDRAADRAAGFELGVWTGLYLEDQLEAIADLYNVMNSAPRDDMEMEDIHITPDLMRQIQGAILAGGNEHWTLYAREKATGALAGFTDVAWNPNRPHILQQQNTGVFPQYRNYGLGRWIKAAMLEWTLERHPEIRYVRTGNAFSNAPMLKINDELGFKPYSSETTWQIETDKVFEYLASRNLLVKA